MLLPFFQARAGNAMYGVASVDYNMASRAATDCPARVRVGTSMTSEVIARLTQSFLLCRHARTIRPNAS